MESSRLNKKKDDLDLLWIWVIFMIIVAGCGLAAVLLTWLTGFRSLIQVITLIICLRLLVIAGGIYQMTLPITNQIRYIQTREKG